MTVISCMNNSILSKEDLYFLPREKAFDFITRIPGEPEMTPFESSYLCGIIKKYKPKKIVEIGVAAGATTAVIMQCLNEIAYDTDIELFSVDLFKEYYRNKSGEAKQTGFLADEYLKKCDCKNICYRKFLGNLLCEVINEIGSDIDLVILDTVHQLPGEVLDFLCILPYVSDSCFVVFHDVTLSLNLNCSVRDCIPTILSFVASNSLSKQVPFFDNSDGSVPNIAAIKLNKDCIKNVEDFFYCFLFPWSYLPNEEEITKYRQFYAEFYSAYLVQIFIEGYKANRKWIQNFNETKWNLFAEKLINRLNPSYETNVSIYGSGELCDSLIKKLLSLNIRVQRIFVTHMTDSNSMISDYKDIPIVEFSENYVIDGDVILVASIGSAFDIREYITSKISDNRNYKIINL